MRFDKFSEFVGEGHSDHGSVNTADEHMRACTGIAQSIEAMMRTDKTDMMYAISQASNTVNASGDHTLMVFSNDPWLADQPSGDDDIGNNVELAGHVKANIARVVRANGGRDAQWVSGNTLKFTFPPR